MLCRSRYTRLDNDEYAVGTVPLKALLPAAKYVSCVRLPNSLGSGPDSELEDTSKCSRSGSAPRVEGSEPA